jgi:hypothetical protein
VRNGSSNCVQTHGGEKAPADPLANAPGVSQKEEEKDEGAHEHSFAIQAPEFGKLQVSELK